MTENRNLLVLHLYVSLFLAVFGFFYVTIKEIVYQNCGSTTVTEKFPNTGDSREWQNILLKKIFSFNFFVVLTTFVTTIWYIM